MTAGTAAGSGPSAPSRHIALDGPSGSGKSTVARALAVQLGWRYVDTGATYRAATLAVLRADVDPADTAAVTAVVDALLDRNGLRLVTDPTAPGVTLDGEDVSAAVRGGDVTGAVSAVSAVPAVRTRLVALQRAAAGEAAVVEGRDIASVVLPAAPVKVYLDADQAVRAARRAADDDAGVAPVSGADLVAQVAADLARRDAADSSRAASPLAAADGAVHVDATELSAAQVADLVLGLAVDAGIAAR